MIDPRAIHSGRGSQRLHVSAIHGGWRFARRWQRGVRAARWVEIRDRNHLVWARSASRALARTILHRVRRQAWDAGSASLLATVWLFVLAVALAVGAGLFGLWRAHAKAGVAADLGALAGADRILTGEAGACAAAHAVVRANAARMIECRVSDLDVRVVAAVALPAGFARVATGGHVLEVYNQAHATIAAE